MWWGYLTAGDTELINVARVMKYAREGGAPDGLRLDPMVGEYADLPAALGHRPYRTALLDSPPWLDATNPDSAQFAGLLPLDLGNLDGSTRTRQVTEGLTDGGTANRSRAASRTIPVTVLAVAASDAALDAGVDWLTGVLHPPCAGATEACDGLALGLFASEPLYCDNVVNEDAEPVTRDLIGQQLSEVPGPSFAYVDVFGDYLTPQCGLVTVTATVLAVGDTAAGQRFIRMDLVDTTGTVYATSGDVVLVPANHASNQPVTISVTVDTTPGFPADWQPVLSWYFADANSYSDTIDAGTAGSPSAGLYDADDADSTAPLITGGAAGTSDRPQYGGDIDVQTWTITAKPPLTAEECLGDLRRSYRNVVTVSGPTVVDRYTLRDGTPFAAKVEWTWVATDPIPYGATTSLLGNLLVGAHGSHPAVARTFSSNVALFQPPDSSITVDRPVTGNALGNDTTVTLGPGARLLLRAQTAPAENGLWVYNGPGAYLTRAEDADTWSELVGAVVYVTRGSDGGGLYYASDAVPGGTLGTTPNHWTVTTAPGDNEPYDDGLTYRAPGLQISVNQETSGEATNCTRPVPSLALCGDDPAFPLITAPPLAPSLPDPGMPALSAIVRRQVQIPPELSPQPAGALSFMITNLGETDYRGIRVRLWDDPDPDFGVTDECDFAQEFHITYLAAGQTLTIAAPDQRATVTCESGIDADAERNLRGPYGGPFAYPEVRCGGRYHLAIDVPQQSGGGGVSVDLAVTRKGV